MPPPKFSRSFEAVYAEDVRRRHASPAPPLELGVKGRLNNQEMEMLRQKLAQATAYDHTPMDKATARQSNVKRPPQFVRASPSTVLMDRETVAVRGRARKKPLAVIHEEQEKLNRFEPQYIPHPTRGIDALAKARLQDEYNTKPRQVSTVPLNLMEKNNQGAEDDAVRAGKRLAPAAIPQVFLL